MTIQQQADEILSRPTVREICKAHDVKTLDQQDELLVRLAQDRAALLKALRHVSEVMRTESTLSLDMERAEKRALVVISEAERP